MDEVVKDCGQVPIALFGHHHLQQARELITDPAPEDRVHHLQLLLFGNPGMFHHLVKLRIPLQYLVHTADLLHKFHRPVLTCFHGRLIQGFSVCLGY